MNQDSVSLSVAARLQVIIAFLILSMAFGNFGFFANVAFFLSYVVLISIARVDAKLKRHCIYGAIFGACLVVAGAEFVAILMGESMQYWHGEGTPMGYARRYALAAGGAGGGLVGLLLWLRAR